MCLISRYAIMNNQYETQNALNTQGLSYNIVQLKTEIALYREGKSTETLLYARQYIWYNTSKIGT